MGTFTPLSDKKTRHIAQSTGLDVIQAYGAASYTFPFVTTDHRHGLWDKKTGDWWWEDPTNDRRQPAGPHFPGCHRRFPDTPMPDDYPRVDYQGIADALNLTLVAPSVRMPDQPTYIVTVGNVEEGEVEHAAWSFAEHLEARGCQVDTVHVRSATPKWLVQVRTTAPFRHTLLVCDWLEE